MVNTSGSDPEDPGSNPGRTVERIGRLKKLILSLVLMAWFQGCVVAGAVVGPVAGGVQGVAYIYEGEDKPLFLIPYYAVLGTVAGAIIGPVQGLKADFKAVFWSLAWEPTDYTKEDFDRIYYPLKPDQEPYTWQRSPRPYEYKYE